MYTSQVNCGEKSKGAESSVLTSELFGAVPLREFTDEYCSSIFIYLSIYLHPYNANDAQKSCFN